jgi:hypothetical protein
MWYCTAPTETPASAATARMLTASRPRSATTDSGRSRWAPWWAYLVPIGAVNYLR